MKKIPTVVLFLILCHLGHSQTLISELDLEWERVEGIQAFPLSDSTFISFSHRDERRCYWINSKGEKREVDLLIQPNTPLVGIRQTDHTLYYYYLNDIGGQLVLRALEQVRGSEKPSFSRPIFSLSDELVGIHMDRDLLTVVVYMKKQERMRIFMLDGLKVLHENSFDVPIDVFPYIRSNSAFIVGNKMIDLQQADRKLKLYREGSEVVITFDEDRPGLKNKRTTIIRMNVATGAKQMYTLQRNDYDEFVSFYFNKQVYQLSHLPKKHIRFDVFDLKSGKFIFSKTFQRDKSMRDQKVIVHRGKSVEVGYTSLYEMVDFSETTPSIIVQRTADSTQLRLILGAVHYYVEPIIIPLPLPLLNSAVLVTFFITPTNSNVRYLTLAGNPETGFEVDSFENNPAPSIRQRIDEHEILRTGGKGRDEKGWDLLFKGYAESNDGVLGIYHTKGRKIMLVKYQHQ